MNQADQAQESGRPYIVLPAAAGEDYDWEVWEEYPPEMDTTVHVAACIVKARADQIAAEHNELTALRDELAAVKGERDDALKWREELTDAAVVLWCLDDDNKDDPKKMLASVVATTIAWENDPAISETAAARRDALEAAEARATLLEQRLAALTEKTDEHTPAIQG